MEYVVFFGILFGLPILIAKRNLMSSSNPADAAVTFFVLSWFVFLAGWWIGAESEKSKIKWDLYCNERSDGSTVCVFPRQDSEARAPRNSGTGKYNDD